jgi:tRNA (cmo5U34)-methyltransferase
MNNFFDTRARSYDNHMLMELKLEVFYDEFQNCIDVNDHTVSFLDLGCGTGLEIERIFNVCPNATVTGIDLSQGMLGVLKEKFKNYSNKLHLICASYFDVDFGQNVFDYVISTYSLHHFSKEEKYSLYKRILVA